MKRQAENFHVVVGMTRLIKMPSYWFGDVLAVVFHIQKMFAEAISQPSSCFADVKLVTGGAPYAIDDIAGSAVEMIGDSRFGHLTANAKPRFAVSGFTLAVCPYLGLKIRVDSTGELWKISTKQDGCCSKVRCEF